MIGDKELIIDACEELGFELIDMNFDYNKNRDNKFYVRCKKCGKICTKTFVSLVKHKRQCSLCFNRNVNYHNSIGEIMPKIKESCEQNDLIFIGFENEKWVKCRDTKLIVECKKCGLTFLKNYDNLVNKNTGCSCNRVYKATITNKLSDEEAMNHITNACIKNSFTFNGFLSEDKKYHNNKTICSLACNKCGTCLSMSVNKLTSKNLLKCKCCHQSLLEKAVKIELIKNGIEFIEQKRFDWLIYKKNMSLDFFLPKYNIGIECQGEQHFKPIDFFGGNEGYIYQKERDSTKRLLCEEHDIRMLYIASFEEIQSIREKIIEITK